MIRVHSTWASGASAIAVPGCPELAGWGASIARPRMTLIACCSSSNPASPAVDSDPTQRVRGMMRLFYAVSERATTEAVKPWTKLRPPTGPSSPAQNMPATAPRATCS